MKKHLFLLSMLATAAVLTPAQTIIVSDFECQAAGAVMTGVPDCEFWTSVDPVPGNERITPDGVNVVVPCAGMPTSGTQWCEVSSQGLGPAGPIVPPSTPGTWPFVAGTVAEMQLVVPVPPMPSGTTALSVDWYWFTAEFTNGSATAGAPCPCNDFAQIVVVDPSTMTTAATLLYVDTYPPYTVTATNTCNSSVANIAFANTVSASTQTATVNIPAALVNQPVLISVVCANQADNAFASALWIDNLRFVDPASLFNLSAVTTGGGVGDLTLDITGIPAASTNVILLLSATPAPAGLGSGPVFGLVPDGLFFVSLTAPVIPFSIFHFPTAANPFAGGPLVLGAGSLSFLAGQTWEATAVGYNLVTGLDGQTNFQGLAW